MILIIQCFSAIVGLINILWVQIIIVPVIVYRIKALLNIER